MAAVALVLAFPRLAPDAFILSVGVVIASYAALAVSWNFVGGFTGYISLGPRGVLRTRRLRAPPC